MAKAKLTARKHVHVAPRRNVVPTGSHSDGQNAGYFSRTLRTVLLSLGYSEPPLFVNVPGLLHGNSYHWHVCVIIYERPTVDQIRHICQWSRLPHQGGHSREAWERLQEKLWFCYDMKQRNKWSNHSTATSQAALEKELKVS
jgi:hypothetical protein